MKSYFQFILLILLSVFSLSSIAGTPPNSIFSYSPSIVCANVPITFIDQSTGGTKIISWNWNFGVGATPTTFSGKIPPTVIYTTVGNKQVSLLVTDSLGNTGSSTQIFNVQNAYANAGTNVSICSTSSATIGSATLSGYSYNWSPSTGLSSATISNPIANPSSTTTYTLTTIALNGCAATSQVIVTNIGVLKANAGSDKLICSGTSVSIGSVTSNNYSYSWNPSAGLSTPNSSTTNVSPNINSVYVITVSAAGCVAKDTVAVFVNQSPIVGKNDTINKCSSSSVAIGVSNQSGLTYSWTPSTNLSASNISNPTSNTASTIIYTLTATDVNLCSSSKSVHVNVYSPIKAFAGLNQNVCFGNSIILGGSPIVASGGTGNYIYNWQPSSTLNSTNVAHPIATPLQSTTYYLTITDSNSTLCGSATDSIILTILPLPHPTINMPTEFCVYSASVSLQGTPSGGYFSGAGITGNTFYPNDPTVVLGTPYPINYSYSLNGCSYDTTISIVVYPKPIANAGIDQLLCTNQGVSSVNLVASGGTTYSWLPSSSLSNANIFNPIASPVSTTTYIVDVTLNGCLGTDTVIVTVSNTCGVDSILIANPDYLRVPTGKSTKINYVVNDNLLNGSLSFTASIFSLAKHGTATISSKNVMHYLPNLNFIGIDTFVYLLQDTTVGAFHNNPVFDTAHVIVNVIPTANDDNYFVHCNDSLAFNPTSNDDFGNGNYAVSLSIASQPKSGAVTLSNNIFTYTPNLNFNGLDSFSYALCVNGLCDTATIHLIVSCINPPIAVDDYLEVGNNETSPTKELTNDSYDPSSPVSVYILTPAAHGTASINNNNIFYTPANGYVGLDSIRYILCNAFGCDTAWIILKVFDNSPCQVPNGFSPNNDGINDVLIINCAPRYEHSRLIIFNRWGNEIFSKIGYGNDWDGNYKGNQVPDGTYYYVFDPNDGVQKTKTGFIEIRR